MLPWVVRDSPITSQMLPVLRTGPAHQWTKMGLAERSVFLTDLIPKRVHFASFNPGWSRRG
jgi:hypothetical protein